MKITEDCIDHNALLIIKQLVEPCYNMITEGEDNTYERGNVLMTLGEIQGVVELAQQLKAVLKV